MQTIGINRISEKDEEISDGLEKIGMSRISALSLVGVRHLGKARTRDIEKITGLRQPEVSIGVRQLKEHGWVSESEEKRQKGKGRPNKVYTLIVPFETILNTIQDEKKTESLTITERIAKLRRLVKESAAKKQ